MIKLTYKLSVILVALFITACTKQYVTKQPFYDELGGEEGIRTFVTKAVELSHAHDRISFLFVDTDDEALIEQLEAQMCELSGGPCKYEGKDMAEAHSGQEITEAEFDIFVEIVIDAMEFADIPHSARNKLLAKLAPMREEILYQ